MTSPTEPVEAQLLAYNRHDLNAFVACYAEDVVAQDLSGGPDIIGRTALREIYRRLFASNPEIQAQALHRAVTGNFVTDHERIVGRASGADGDAVVVFHVHEGLIDRIWFVR